MTPHRIRSVQFIPVSPECAWEFFSDPRNLPRITPPWLSFELVSDPPGRMYPGLLIEYRVRPLWGIPLRWLTEITHVAEPHLFVDEQRLGPYRLWHHQHRFRAVTAVAAIRGPAPSGTCRSPWCWADRWRSALFMTFLPQLKAVPGFGISLMSAVTIIVFGFFFSVVSSRITGELGSSSNPVSGMAIATLMGTCLIFIALGWTGHAYTAAALSIGTVVCIASSNAGTTSQDLKTSFLVGGTPWRQQLAIIVGVATSVVFIGGTIQAINRNYTRVQDAQYAVVLQVAADAESRPGLDGRAYRVARAAGRSPHPPKGRRPQLHRHLPSKRAVPAAAALGHRARGGGGGGGPWERE